MAGGPIVYAQLEDALAAARDYGQQLEEVERGCRERFADGPCGSERFLEIASRYQRCFSERENPKQFEGRIDALPRLSHPGMSEQELSVRMATACTERCSLARRIAVASAIGEASELCANNPDKGRKLCRALGARSGSDASKRFVEDCLDRCDSSRQERQEVEARERRRPRNKAQAAVCFQGCMRRCTGGRIVPALDGSFRRDPNEWCGTCEHSCRSGCTVVTEGP
jgi:hypothetical protein